MYTILFNTIQVIHCIMYSIHYTMYYLYTVAVYCIVYIIYSVHGISFLFIRDACVDRGVNSKF